MNISIQYKNVTTLYTIKNIKVTVKPRGVCYKNGSPGKTTEPIYIKQSVDEYKKNDLWCIQDNILQLIFKLIFLWL